MSAPKTGSDDQELFEEIARDKIHDIVQELHGDDLMRLLGRLMIDNGLL